MVPHLESQPQSPGKQGGEETATLRGREGWGEERETHLHPDRDLERRTETERHCLLPDERSQSQGRCYLQTLNIRLYQNSVSNERKQPGKLNVRLARCPPGDKVFPRRPFHSAVT